MTGWLALLMSLFCRRLLLLICALALGGCAKRGDPSEAARAFFQQLAAGETSAAYAVAAFGFQAQQTEKAFAQKVKEMGLEQQDSLAWSAPEVLGDEATVNVEVTSAGGRQQRFIVTLVYEAGAWRVHSLRNPRGASGSRTENRFTLVGKGAGFSDAQSLPMPEESDLRISVLQTMLRFDEAVREKSFAGFYREVSLAWQKQLSISQLERAFQPFIQNDVKISGLSEAELHFDSQPVINSQGILAVNGHFRTAPYRVFFTMKFVYELPRWKLFGLDVNLQQ